jgi:hypothetical protein
VSYLLLKPHSAPFETHNPRQFLSKDPHIIGWLFIESGRLSRSTGWSRIRAPIVDVESIFLNNRRLYHIINENFINSMNVLILVVILTVIILGIASLMV